MDITRENEVERLREEKKVIERRLKELQDTSVTCGRVRFDRELHYEKEYRVCVNKFFDSGRSSAHRWTSIIRSKSKEKAISQIKPIIEDLQELLKAIGENE